LKEEKRAAAHAEKERIAAEQAEAKRLEAERAEAERRLAAERADAERLEAAYQKADRVAKNAARLAAGLSSGETVPDAGSPEGGQASADEQTMPHLHRGFWRRG
jgi:membrane protein involved in colicin uptake